jgi:hypothetical protein
VEDLKLRETLAQSLDDHGPMTRFMELFDAEQAGPGLRERIGKPNERFIWTCS